MIAIPALAHGFLLGPHTEEVNQNHGKSKRELHGHIQVDTDVLNLIGSSSSPPASNYPASLPNLKEKPGPYTLRLGHFWFEPCSPSI